MGAKVKIILATAIPLLLVSRLALLPFACAIRASLLETVKQIHADPKYPDVRFLKAVGISEKSLEDAENKGKAEISRQISARMESSLESLEEYIRKMDNGKEVEQSMTIVTERIKITSNFQWVGFIESDPAKAEEVKEEGKKHFLAFVYLDKGKFLKAISIDFEKYGTELLLCHERAQEIYSDPDDRTGIPIDIASFTLNFRNAHKAYEALVALDLQSLAVAEEHLSPYETYYARFLSLLRLRTRLLSQLVFCTVVDGEMAAQEKRALQEALISALADKGLRFVPCDQAGKEAHGYQINIFGEGKSGQALYPYYQIDLNISVCGISIPSRSCAQEGILDLSKTLKASERTEELARKAMIEGLKEALRSALAPGMEVFFPLL